MFQVMLEMHRDGERTTLGVYYEIFIVISFTFNWFC